MHPWALRRPKLRRYSAVRRRALLRVSLFGGENLLRRNELIGAGFAHTFTRVVQASRVGECLVKVPDNVFNILKPNRNTDQVFTTPAAASCSLESC